jgi:alkanesulfonate monooxygenase SsuD/methylene tetrahydromethanopterin reductase-like flavin-dependent oxidoreductase (luciferase family)
MKFGLMFANTGPFSHPESLARLAQAAEERGVESLWTARRAARLGNGFFPARGDRDTLTRLFAVLRDECAKVGRKPDEIELTTGAGGKTDVDAVKRYQEMGVRRLMISPAGFDEESVRRGLDDFAERVIAKLS